MVQHGDQQFAVVSSVLLYFLVKTERGCPYRNQWLRIT